MKYANIILEKDGPVCTLVINRPEVRNALNAETWQELRAAVSDLERDSAIRAVIITGAGGKAFAAGADIRALQQWSTLDILRRETNRILQELSAMPKPVIAAINGYALGGGCELSLACDIRIAASSAKLGFPELGLGIIPGNGGTQRLQRLVGAGRAKELIFTGAVIDAAEAWRIGLVNKVVEDAELLPAARAMADKILEKGPVAVALAKAAIDLGANTDLASGLAFEQYAQSVAFATQDRAEGLAAFLEKRPPAFNGR